MTATLALAVALAQPVVPPSAGAPARWSLAEPGAIEWNVAADARLPHGDDVEMSGRRVSVVVRYAVDASRRLSIVREVYVPGLRRALAPGESDWNKYRAYLTRKLDDGILPLVEKDGARWEPPAVDTIRLDGVLLVRHAASDGLRLERTLYPSARDAAFHERWVLTNVGAAPARVAVRGGARREEEEGVAGPLFVETVPPKATTKRLGPGRSTTIDISIRGYAGRDVPKVDAEKDLEARRKYVAELAGALRLVTPEPLLDRAFLFAKLRTNESLFETKMGLVHSPGGGRYYGGVWANDQVEYAGPFLPLTGYAPAAEAALTAYRRFARDMKPDYTPLTSSFEMEGDYTCCGKDRGDAAMFAYGATRFVLATGRRDVADELWPAIEWALEYCRRRTNEAGVVSTETDEMEGRIDTGGANLATSALAYGGLVAAARLGRDLGHAERASEYGKRATDLRAAIDRVFGADIQGFHTYRYFVGHEGFRHWMGLPLAMGIADRAQDTIAAMFSKLWMGDGLRVQDGQDLYWDRGTLYALNGALRVGDPDVVMPRVRDYVSSRLVGEHVPYAIEAFPEGNKAHLAAESSLFGRVFVEGLFGIDPTGLASFDCRPRLPSGWDRMELRDVHAFGAVFDVRVVREAGKVRVGVVAKGRTVVDALVDPGATVAVRFR